VSILRTTTIGTTATRFELFSIHLKRLKIKVAKIEDSMAYRLTKQALWADLYAAFLCAKRHKANQPYVLHFERRKQEILTELADALWNRTYKPEPSTCFIIERPKKREVFAAQFRDRVVHHLYYNYTHRLFERTFIADTYSCIPGRGTHYGIGRMKKHILAESENYSRECWVLKLDIRGYFMHIDRQRLLEISMESLKSMRHHRISKGGKQTWDDKIDFPFVEWLTKEIVLLNPSINCHIAGSEDDWTGLDPAKTLRYAGEGKGLPIGNLTSQLYSNVYMNVFDQYMKRTLKCSHYGRYVDDAYVVSTDKKWLLSIIPEARHFLKNSLDLDLHMGKTRLFRAGKGAEFLGAYIKPHRTYIDNKALERSRRGIETIDTSNAWHTYLSIYSYLGVLRHYASYNIRRQLFLKERFLKIATYDDNISIFNKPVFC
jgi:retron-type reverse transcriptase